MYAIDHDNGLRGGRLPYMYTRTVGRKYYPYWDYFWQTKHTISGTKFVQKYTTLNWHINIMLDHFCWKPY